MRDEGRLRTVAVVEFIKGAATLAIALGIMGSGRHVLADGGLALLQALTIDGNAGLGQSFLGMLAAADAEHGLLMLGAGSYSLLRFVEAYGLWKLRDWARWLGLVSAGAYIPFEIYFCIRTPSLATLLVMLVNVAILWLLWPRRRSELEQESFPRSTEEPL